ncbi:MAG: Rieske (2Fe-2S) protein [Myxococcales bacterium]
MSRERIELEPVALGPEEMRGLDFGERLVLLSRVDGRWCAIDDWCNHAGCQLSAGRREGRTVICPCHDIGFDLVTGRNLTSPEICGDQAAFTVEEHDGGLILILGPRGGD